MACSFASGTSGSFSLEIPAEMFSIPEEQINEMYRKKVASLDKVPGAQRMFRTWRLTKDNTLRAMNTSYAWRAGENIASSMRDRGHNGFFGFSTLSELQKQEAVWWTGSQTGQPVRASLIGQPVGPASVWYVSGTFLGYGHMVVAEHGGRIQYGVPEYIIEPDGSDPDFALRILNVAEKYGMDIISIQTALELKTGRVPYWKGRPIK